MSINQAIDHIKDYAKDIRLNLGTVLTPEGAPGLSDKQIWLIALATTYTTKSAPLREAVEGDATKHLSIEEIDAAKAAATIMAMNNVYYRTLHLAEDAELSKLPAKLRMNIIAKPGINKVDFELASLAVSAITGCGACIKAHIKEAAKAGISHEGIQSSVRIAAVINAASQALAIG